MVDIIFFLKRSFPLVYRFDVPVVIHYGSLRDRHDLKAGLDIASKILQKCSYGLYKISFSIEKHTAGNLYFLVFVDRDFYRRKRYLCA